MKKYGLEQTFSNDIVNEAHRKSKENEISQMVDETIKTRHDVDLLALMSLIESDLLAVGN